MSTFGGTVVDVGDTFIDDGGVVVEIVVKFALIDELRVIGVDGLDFDGNLEVGPGVDSLIDFSKGSFINFFHYFKVLANFLKHLWHDDCLNIRL